MASEAKTFTIIIQFESGADVSAEGAENLLEAYNEFKAHVKERLTRDLPANRGTMTARLVSISES